MANLISRRILRGFGANLYGQAVVIVIQLAGVPILLHYWGVDLYGEWLILFAIPAYLSITDLGFSQSAGNDMTSRVARGDTEGALAVFQSLSVLVYSTALVALGATSVLVFTLPLNEWLNLSYLAKDEAGWTLWFLVAAVLAQLPDGVTHAGFRANGDYALHRVFYFTIMATQYAALWLLAALGHGPVVAAAAFAAVRCLATPAAAVLLVRRHRVIRFGLAQARLRELRHLVRPAMANVAMPLAQAINIQGMVLVVGATLGPAAVVVFSTLRTLTRLAVRTLLSVSQALEPEMATAWGAGNKVLLQRLYTRGMAASLWLALGITLTLYVLGNWILLAWTQGRVAMDATLFGWLLASAVASVLWYSGLNVLKAANRHLRAAFWYVLSSLAAIMLGALLIHWTGNLANAGLALVIMDTLMASYLLVLASRMVDISIPELLIKLVDPRPVFLYFLRRLPHVR